MAKDSDVNNTIIMPYLNPCRQPGLCFAHRRELVLSAVSYQRHGAASRTKPS